MRKYNNILEKLNRFTKKFYTTMLVRGVLLFFAFGLLFFLIVLGVENLLWLNSTGRFLLLLAFIAVELLLLLKYILTPIFYLFKFKKGISNKEASLLIGKHFSEVGDKLFNLLDLIDDHNKSELLLASIEQRSENLSPVPFAKAIDFRESVKYVKYVMIPILVVSLIWFSGHLQTFFGSYNRVINYDLAFEPPAPFSFKLLSDQLNVLESKTFTAQVITEGSVRPENVYIVIDGVAFLLQEYGGVFEYTLSPPLKDAFFYFIANGIKSRSYKLNALKAPSIQDFTVVLDYPAYTKKPKEVLKSTGNATVPEGTTVTWQINGVHTEHIDLVTNDTLMSFERNKAAFVLSKDLYSNFPYQIATSNENVDDYEKLDYRFNVIKDDYPMLKVRQVVDSLNLNVSYYVGEASDDYKLSDIRLVCYPIGDSEKSQTLDLGKPDSNFERFYYTFPSGLDLIEGRQYSFYFEAIDNDAIHKGKAAKSQTFTTALLTEEELRNIGMESQQAIIDKMDGSLERFKEQKKTLEEINAEQKEKSQLNFNDQNQIKDFLKKQRAQEGLMQRFSKQLKESLENVETDDEMNKLLKERLERQELEAEKNAKLLEELGKIADKIEKEELGKRLDELGKKQQNSERNLEQVLELTKRYYVTEKASQLAKDLEKLAERQEILSELRIGQDFSNREQEGLNQDFEKLARELDELRKDNLDLKKPLDLKIEDAKMEEVKRDQQEALEEINKHQGNDESSESSEKQKNADKAKLKQKSAAQKMKEMGQGLGASASGGGSTITEDAEMLRQILDNLVTFSFKQEDLFDNLEDADTDALQFSNTIRRQQELRELFEHVDDSLFALSLRRAELSEFVNEQISEVYYNIDKSLEGLGEDQIYQSASFQKYVLTASNDLADFLAKILDNMQSSMMSGKGSGEGDSFQLPDIIKGQGELKEKMEGKGKTGKGAFDGGGEEGQGESQEGQKENSVQDKVKDGKGGQKGNGSRGMVNDLRGEEELSEIYEIYKSQQLLREGLEQQLQDMINASDRKLGEKLIRQMEDFENDLLENGITQRSIDKINNIQYELLKLANASLRQGRKQERESNSGKERFENPITTKPSLLDNYRNEIEILNRQALPLRQNFQNKVKDYFKGDD